MVTDLGDPSVLGNCLEEIFDYYLSPDYNYTAYNLGNRVLKVIPALNESQTDIYGEFYYTQDSEEKWLAVMSINTIDYKINLPDDYSFEDCIWDVVPAEDIRDLSKTMELYFSIKDFLYLTDITTGTLEV